MTLGEFRKRVQAEFGSDLANMTPANVREFLDQIQPQLDGTRTGERVRLDEPERTYEGIVRDFLRRSLELPPDQALIRLWTCCLELAYADVNELEADRYERLFAGFAADPD